MLYGQNYGQKGTLNFETFVTVWQTKQILKFFSYQIINVHTSSVSSQASKRSTSLWKVSSSFPVTNFLELFKKLFFCLLTFSSYEIFYDITRFWSLNLFSM